MSNPDKAKHVEAALEILRDLEFEFIEKDLNELQEETPKERPMRHTIRHIIPRTNWTTHLANVLEDAHPGDTIVCFSDSVLELAERAHQRMCPDKHLTFIVEADQ